MFMLLCTRTNIVSVYSVAHFTTIPLIARYYAFFFDRKKVFGRFQFLPETSVIRPPQ